MVQDTGWRGDQVVKQRGGVDEDAACEAPARHARARAALQATYLYTALESPRVTMAVRAVVPANAVQPDVDSRVMESVSDLIMEVKPTVRPTGASKDTEAYTSAETTEMMQAAMKMRDEMVLSEGWAFMRGVRREQGGRRRRQW